MGRYTIPDETNPLSLLTEPDVRTFVKVKCNDKLLPVFEKSRAESDKVTGFIPAAEGVEFSVGWYCGRTKRPKISTLIEVYFGETFIRSSFHLASDTNPEDPLDKRGRFVMFDSVKVGEDHKQNYMFGKIPTTDDQEAAAKDLDYLDSVSAIRIKAYHIKNARWVITRWEDPSPAQPASKSSRKRNANEIDASESPTKNAPASNSKKKADQDAVDSDRLPTPEVVRKVEASLRPIDEKSDKGQFGLAPSFGPRRGEERDPSEYERQRYRRVWNNNTIRPEPACVRNNLATVVFVRVYPRAAWISRHLDAFFFQPKPSTPLPEPTVEVGGAIYVDTTAEEAEEDACTANVIERPSKRQKVVEMTETEEEDQEETEEEDNEEEEEDREEDEGEGEGGYDDYYNYSVQEAAALAGHRGNQAVLAKGDSFSLLAEVPVGGTTASQRQAAEEHTKSQASQLVLSLAQDHPGFRKIKQEVFARGSSSDRARMSETAEASTDATTNVLDAPSSSPVAARDRTATQAWTPDGSSVSSSVNASQPEYQPALQGQSNYGSPSAPQVRTEQQQPLFTAVPRVKPFQSRTRKSSHGASAATSTATTGASGSGVGTFGARVVGMGSQTSMKR